MVEFVAPCHAPIIRSSAAPYCLHQCLDATPFLDSMVGTGAGDIAFHELVDLGKAKLDYGKSVILAGNLGGSQNIMCEGLPQDVEAAARDAIGMAKEGCIFWLSGGCEIHQAFWSEHHRFRAGI